MFQNSITFCKNMVISLVIVYMTRFVLGWCTEFLNSSYGNLVTLLLTGWCCWSDFSKQNATDKWSTVYKADKTNALLVANFKPSKTESQKHKANSRTALAETPVEYDYVDDLLDNEEISISSDEHE